MEDDWENRWSDMRPMTRAVIALAMALLSFVAMHLAGHPAFGVAGSVVVAACVWIVFYIFGGAILAVLDGLSNFIPFWWWP